MDSEIPEPVKNKKEVKYECNTCFENKPENFYPYLPTKCMNCKKKASRNKKTEKLEEKRLEKINTIDSDNKIRDIIEELFNKDRVFEGKSYNDTLKNIKSDIKNNYSEMDFRFGKASSYLNEFYKQLMELKNDYEILKSSFEEYKVSTNSNFTKMEKIIENQQKIIDEYQKYLK
jgi:hypothetical protein